mgnify:CR=1 FL=1
MMKAYEAELPINLDDNFDHHTSTPVLPTQISNYFKQVLEELYQGEPHENYGITHDFFHILQGVNL